MANLFEQTMLACQKAKMEESKKPAKKKVSKKKVIKESNKRAKSRRKLLTEDEDIEIEDDDEPVADDVSGDIVAVVDPDMDTDEYDDKIDELQDIVDGTPEGEVPVDDEYIGDTIYQCPVCGNPFFSEDDLGEGGNCPVCGEEIDSFVELGEVQSADDEGEEPVEDEDDINEPAEDDDLDADIDDLDESEDPTTIDDSDIIEDYSIPKTPKKRPGVKSKCEKYSRYSIDEKSLNPFLTKMIKENYKNAESMKLIRASIAGKRLKLECAIKFKSGNSKKSTIVVENFKPAKRMSMKGQLGSMFKTESRQNKSDITIGARLVGDTIKVESFKYDYVIKKENKKYNVYGSYVLKESARRKIMK